MMMMIDFYHFILYVFIYIYIYIWNEILNNYDKL